MALREDCHLTEDDLSDEAKQLFPFHKEILESLNLCKRTVLSNDGLTAIGKHIFCSKTLRSHNNVKSVLNYLASKPLVRKENIDKFPMIFIVGQARTGTTLLYNLMACDPACRAPRLTDMTVQPIPPILRSNIDEHKRRAENERSIVAKEFEAAKCDIEKYRKNKSSSHAVYNYEEDSNLFLDIGVRVVPYVITPGETDYHIWYRDNQDKDFLYMYHKTFFQMLHDADPPRTHWLLKSPSHTFWLDLLLKYYPQASLIMTHRRLDNVIASTCSLSSNVFGFMFDENNSTASTLMWQKTLDLINIGLERVIEFRNRQPPPTDVLDIQYEDLIKDPIATVRRIYDQYDFLQWSDDFENAMRTWLLDNPQGKQGQHQYSLEKFDLNDQWNKELYEKYEMMFLSPDTTDSAL